MYRRYLYPFKTHRLPQVLADVLVIGGGVAGLRAAIAASESSDVLLITKQQLSESNTFYAQGGIATVMQADDSFQSHINDTMKVACGLGDRAAVETVVKEAPARIEELIRWGANFDREIDGSLAFAREGGHSAARIIHALGDATGRELATSLASVVRGREAISILEHTFVLDLITLEGRCIGALAWNQQRSFFVIFARKTLLASGGAGALFRETTNPPIATADGHAMAWRAGAALRDMEMVQFHPTTIYIAGATRSLVSEAVRGEGAKLIDKSGYRFMPDYHPQAELAPRDVVSRCILAQMVKTRTTHVFLDCRHMSEEAFRTRFPNIYQVCQKFGINPAKQPIPIHPSAHYMVGGVACDLFGRTSLENLYAIGEASYTGLHGANRLASNSLIEALVFGKRAGEDAVRSLNGHTRAHMTPRVQAEVPPSQRTELDMQDVLSSLRSLMWRNAGIERVGPRLQEALEIIDFWSHYVLDKVFESPAGWELQNMLQISRLITAAAEIRQETRGVHYRTDFPETDDRNWRCHLDWRSESPIPVKSPIMDEPRSQTQLEPSGSGSKL
ncbi:MAG TPA: L-aspartate oxidase [Phycisphaerae bacterium]|nr:L-aspartate oxidase [Phycisphaerae bacterium]